MKKESRLIKVIAKNNENTHGFDICLIYHGRQEYLLSHRHNGLLFNLLKDGIHLDELRLWRPTEVYRGRDRRSRKNRSAQMESMVRHLVSVVDDYVDELKAEAC